MGAENGPEAAFRESDRNLAQQRTDPPTGPSGRVFLPGIFCQSVQLETVWPEEEVRHVPDGP